ncbi:hypothetical protein BB560_001280 [Smittium megazygosporum]|uniref:VOC domain-containing protein n=1 Tax=Smittium megazygosporum TaxID=133381 RepID=A0A2T9ZI07_9FUNG|nr:hypothetical protein BB560_001280 [Smittium megazygosporum]
MVGYKDQDAGAKSMFARGSMIEFEYIYGTDTDPNFKGYETGNQNQDGFGHFAIIVDNLPAAVERFDKLGVNFVKRPEEGGMSHIAFITDPDGYYIEIIANADLI